MEHAITESAVERGARPGTLRALGELSKPRITLMAWLCALLGALLGQGSGALSTFSLAYALLAASGTGLLVAAANALNCWMERDIDGHMTRTRGRPLPSGRLDPAVALTAGVLCGAGAVAALLYFNPLTAALGLASLVVYVGIYTPLKQRSCVALWVGAIPGAMPPVLGWTATHGALSAEAYALFLWMFCWQIPHFIAISNFRWPEYEAAGLKTVTRSVGEPYASWLSSGFAALTVGATLWMLHIGLGGPLFAWVAGASGLIFAVGHVLSSWPALSARLSRPNFFYSLAYLTFILGALGAEWGLGLMRV